MRRSNNIGAAALAAALVLSAEARSIPLSVPSVRDNTLFEDSEGAISNGAGPAVYVGDNSSSSTRRAVLVFDVPGHVPSGATITNAELRLHVSSVPAIHSSFVRVHRLLADWGEGVSFSSGGGGAPSQPGDATWIHRFFPDSLWAGAGGNFLATQSAATAVPDTGRYVWTGPELIADVQFWVDHPSMNFGWVLIGEEGLAQSARRVDSKEAVEEAVRPVLWIEVETVAVDPVSWGRTKTAYR